MPNCPPAKLLDWRWVLSLTIWSNASRRIFSMRSWAMLVAMFRVLSPADAFCAHEDGHQGREDDPRENDGDEQLDETESLGRAHRDVRRAASFCQADHLALLPLLQGELRVRGCQCPPLLHRLTIGKRRRYLSVPAGAARRNGVFVQERKVGAPGGSGGRPGAPGILTVACSGGRERCEDPSSEGR